MHYSFEFDEFDNPMQLSKVGNWVFTFLSPQQQIKNIQLAITNVIPRHVNSPLQARRLVIESLDNENTWQLLQLECFDGETQKEVLLASEDMQTQEILEQILTEFSKYDVDIKLQSLT